MSWRSHLSTPSFNSYGRAKRAAIIVSRCSKCLCFKTPIMGRTPPPTQPAGREGGRAPLQATPAPTLSTPAGEAGKGGRERGREEEDGKGQCILHIDGDKVEVNGLINADGLSSSRGCSKGHLYTRTPHAAAASQEVQLIVNTTKSVFFYELRI